MPGGPWPGTGAVVAAVEAATGVRAVNAGKPAAQPFLTALDRLGADPAAPRALVVGDRLDSDADGRAGGRPGRRDRPHRRHLRGSGAGSRAGAGRDRRQPRRPPPAPMSDAGMHKDAQRMPRSVTLLVNPSAGGGRALRALPAVQAELDAPGPRAPHRAHGLASPTPNRWRGAAADAGRIVVTLSGDGLIGAVAGALRGRPGAVMGILPGGRGNDFARANGIPLRSRWRPAALLATGEARPMDVGDVDGRTFVGIASLGFDSDRQPHRQRGAVRAWVRSCTPTRRCARSRPGGPRRSTSSSTGSAARSRGWTVAAANSRAYGGGMLLAPDARLDDGELDVVLVAPRSRCEFVALPADGVQGHARPPGRRSPCCAGAEVRDLGRPPVRRLRRRRPDRRAAGDRPRRPGRDPRPAARVTLLGAKLAAARAAGVVSRRAGRGGTSLPGKLLLRLEPGAVGALSRAPGRGQRGHLGHQRQDDDAPRWSPRSSSAAGARLVHNRAGANMAGGVAGALLEAAGRGGSIAGDTGLFEVDEFWLDRLVPQLHPRALLLGNLFRDQLDRYGELETIADRWARRRRRGAGHDARAQRRRPAHRRPRPRADRHRARPVLRRRGPGDGAERTWRTPPTPSTAAAAARPTATTSSSSDTWATTTATRAARRGRRPQVAAERVVLDGLRGAQVTMRTPAGTVEVRLPLPGLYNVYNMLGAAALALALGASPADLVAGLQTVSPAFGRAESVALAGRDVLLLLVKNPAGANEVLRTLALEDGEHDLLAVLNDNIADGRDVSWVWDADFETLAGRLRRVTCSGTRAAEMALRLKYAGVPEDRLVVAARSQPGPRRRAGRRLRTPGRDPDLHGHARAATAHRRPRGGREQLRMTGTERPEVIWHDVECGGYAEDVALWRELADAAPGGTVLDVGAGSGRVALDLAARGAEVVALDAEAALLEALARRAGDLPVHTVCADARDFALGREFGLIIVPMQTLQLLGGPEGRAAFLHCAREHLVPGGTLAAALADALDSFDTESDGLPEPDVHEAGGMTFASRPLAVVDEGDRAAIHRLREIIAPDGARSETLDVIRLDRVTAAEVQREAASLGFRPRPVRRIPATDVYVGSTVVVLGG